ncbi:MAG: hypothetical protein ACREQQ_02340 [Candidatus Binatia bacterium]
MNAFTEEHYARLAHADGTGRPLGSPDVFDYRSIANDFSIWGWSFHVEREPVEFLNLRDVSATERCSVLLHVASDLVVGYSNSFDEDVGGA